MQQDKKELLNFNNIYIKDLNNNYIFQKLTFEVFENERIFILGHTDKERTLILYHILGLIKPIFGNIEVFGRSLSSLRSVKILDVRKKIGYVHAQKGLINNISLKSNISLPLRFNSNLKQQDIDEKINRISRLFGLDEILKKNIWEADNLSCKKVLFARAVINDPRLLLIDEPTTYIEQKDIQEIIKLFEIMMKTDILNKKSSIVVTSENIELAKTYGDKILYLKNGKIEYWGKAKDFNIKID